LQRLAASQGSAEKIRNPVVVSANSRRPQTAAMGQAATELTPKTLEAIDLW
jgi:hypothetical protein